MDLTAQQQSYCFPILKNNEVLQVLSTLGIDLTEQELSEPARHRDTIRNVFIQLIDVALGVPEDELFKPAPESLNYRASLEFPELHEESISEIRFIKHCIKLMNVCGIPDFGIRDLVNPTPRRLRRQMSGLVNFIRYREDKLGLYDEMVQHRLDNFMSPFDQAKEENLLLTEQLQFLKRESEQDWKAIETVQNECAAIEIEITRMNKLQASIRQENNQMKKKVNDIIDEIETKTLALQELQAEEKNLSQQVVKSPDRIQKELDEVVASLETQKRDTALVEKEIQNSRNKINCLIEAKEDILKVMSTMDEVKGAMFEFNEVQAQVGDAKSALDESTKQAKQVSLAVEELEKNIKDLEQKMEQNTTLHQRGMEKAHEDYKKAQHDMLVVEREKRDGMAQVNNAEADLIALESIISKERSQHQTELEEMMQTYRRLESAMLQQDATLLSAIGCVP